MVCVGQGGQEVRLATIDVGTNTAPLLISEWEDGALNAIFNAGGFVRLGEGMDASGRVAEAALARLQAVLFSHMEQIRRLQVGHIIITGTSASRDAADAHRIRSLVRNMTGCDFTILSGEEEALATFLGACAGLGPDQQADAAVTVVDVGGGSTELVQGSPTGSSSQLGFRTSLDMGSVRMTERYFRTQPATSQEIDTAVEALRAMLQSQVVNHEKTDRCIGASGTPIVLALLHYQVDELESISTVATMTRSEVAEWSEKLFTMTQQEIIELYPAKMRGRADVFPAAVRILLEAMDHVGAQRLIVSPYGVRHGTAIRYFIESGE